jgi:Na+/proline symporter
VTLKNLIRVIPAEGRESHGAERCHTACFFTAPSSRSSLEFEVCRVSRCGAQPISALILAARAASDGASLQPGSIRVNVYIVGSILVVAAAAFAASGILYARRRAGSLEDYITARGTVGTWSGVATLVASALGAWVLFGPAEAATWGGIGAVVGYALGAAAPRFAFIPLGRRMREVMPEGHSLTEFLWHRYGRSVYIVTLLVMLFYMFIFITAELTGLARLVALIAEIPLWVTAAWVMATTLAYTAYGGLRASIFTDAIQLVIILPVLLTLLVIGWIAVGGTAETAARLFERAPHLGEISYMPGLEAGLTLFLAVLLTSIFHQGYWQRVFASRDRQTLGRSFFIAGIVGGLFVFAMGLFGLAFVAHDLKGPASSAVFVVLSEALPLWAMLVVLVLGLALVMSSADTIINAVASIIAADLGRAMPGMGGRHLMGVARWLIVAASVPVVVVAAQGYSVLYLFLLADLLCAAVAFPVFFGLYSRRYDGTAALFSIIAGLVAGAAVFPDPALETGHLLGSFLLAFLVPFLVSLIFLTLRRSPEYDFETLRMAVHRIAD